METARANNPVGGEGRIRPAPGKTEVNGILVLDKPEGITSFAAVDKARRWLRLKKAGHCGTLDPIATGVLVICVNQATRIAELLSGHDKVYRFTVRMGVETDTLDRAGEVTAQYEGEPRTREELERAIETFRGGYRQEVPKYAAVKVQGKRLYKWARAGVEMERPTRDVSLPSIELIDWNWPEAVMEVSCSKGTYIRQLVSDIGREMGCGAHVAELKRLASGPFTIDQAVSLEELRQAHDGGDWMDHLIPLSKALNHLPSVTINEQAVLDRLLDGHLDPRWEARNLPGFIKGDLPVRLLDPEDNMLAIWWPKPAAGQRKLRLFR